MAPPPAPGFDLTEVDRLLSTTRAVRRHLDLERPVPRSVIEECLEVAVQAPNATNAQDWRWLVVTDAALRREIGALYREILRPISLGLEAERRAAGDAAGLRHSASVLYLVEHLGAVPALVIPCIRGTLDQGAGLADLAGLFGSVYPAVWSFQLALRSRGLGSTFTTAHLLRAGEVAALLGIPDTYLQTCLLPVAWSRRPDFSPGPRRPVSEILCWDRWDRAAGGAR